MGRDSNPRYAFDVNTLSRRIVGKPQKTRVLSGLMPRENLTTSPLSNTNTPNRAYPARTRVVAFWRETPASSLALGRAWPCVDVGGRH